MQMTSANGATPLAIEMNGLSKHFGPHRAVDTLNLTVSAGTVFGFLGPNGAGKTTTIRMLLGLIRPTKNEEMACRCFSSRKHQQARRWSI